MTPFSALYDFVGQAVKNRKYKEAAEDRMRRSLKLFEAELNEDERSSVSLFSERFRSIYESVCAKNRDKYTLKSLDTYRSVVVKILRDYENYGSDYTKWSGWNPKEPRLKTMKKASGSTGSSEVLKEGGVPVGSNEITKPGLDAALHRVTLTFRPGVVCTLVVPIDISEAEANRVKGVLDSLVN